ncbi:capsular biosynthesis protein [Sinorhizobium meliloti]|uniref:capsular polysaccharide export protein, LipB/KpsS family n=1 Tax=Rhizobium meliloti TaxID=382 RepID=UPI000FDA79ED|nr:capsular biosynthesis protein [Sinorhizobium meliloti]RVP97718.1 capsular biosynthesis protein [Sinorhizobium meliloti]
MRISQDALITAIIPVRLSADKLYDEVERIERIVATLPDAYTALIVDYGTGPSRSGELRDVARRCGIELVRVESGDEPFSVGAARDIGTQHAKTPLVMYHDIDFLMSRDSYLKVVAECRLRGMPDKAYVFFALPGAYLSEDFTSKYLDLLASGDGTYADMLVHDGLMRHDKTVYESNTFAISAIVANRYHLLAIGGHDRSFKGHGAEDFELMHRLTSYYLKGPRTKEYYKNTKSNSIMNYEGFRAFYALYGIDLFQRGLVIAHLWHPRRKDVGYVGTNNQARVSDAMSDYDRGRTFLMPLEDETSSEKTLVLVNPGTSPARAIRHVYPAFGHYRIVPEKSFAEATDLIDFMDTEGFTRVFFLNPYGNEHRLALYRGIKEAGRRFIAYDRGAYNDSWFFDTKGFLGESGSYSPELWDHPLSEEERAKLDEWLVELRLSEETLERNGARVGREHLRNSLKVGDRKIIFVALQRPSDTATVHFSGPCHDAYTFNTWISNLAARVDKRKYAIVVKKHPLETARPNLDDVVFAPDDAHIADLIELSDKTVVINSGTGLIALTHGKPVICCGQSFYCHSGLAWQAHNQEELLQLAQSELTPDAEKCARFTKYLTQDFYSFGKSRYADQTVNGGNRIADRILFSVIRGLTEKPIELGIAPKGISLEAPLFYSFGGREAIKGAQQTSGVVKRSPNALELMRKGAVAFHKKDFAEAAKHFEDACILNQANPGYLRSAAEAHYRLGDKSKALALLDKALQISPTNKSIKRRKNEMTRPPVIGKVLGERPFPIKLP